MDISAAAKWAEQEFGGVDLGDQRRTRRLVRVATQAMVKPHGRLTATFSRPAEREAAFRLLESDALQSRALLDAVEQATARRAADFSFAFVPVDATSLNVADHARRKGTGVVGARYVGARGILVMSAIAVAPTGTPLGIANQLYWARRGRKRRKGPVRKDRRKFESKESHHWVAVTRQVTRHFAQHAPSTTPWFQLDRGGDVRQVLEHAHDQGLLMTVRASASRRLWTQDLAGRRRYVRTWLAAQPVRSYQKLTIVGTVKRRARQATLAVRFASVELDLHDDRGNQRRCVPMSAVMVREVGTSPRGEEPIEWLLLTTHPVQNQGDAELVVHGYATRWSIEEFHKTWKTDGCNVERTQLHSFERMVRWATILAAVAMRIQRLMKLARHEPELPATVELTRGEIKAIIVATKHQKMTAKPDDILNIAEAVKWLGSLGGHSPSPSAGPPGARTIERGLEHIASLAAYFDDPKCDQ
jgi:hypothetical protein